MKIKFLGTAAAEGIPSPYCDCTTCDNARAKKGKEIRRRSSYLINKELLIDMGADLFNSCAEFDENLIDLKHILISHSHHDHFFIQNVLLRNKKFRKNTKLSKVDFIAGPSVMANLSQNVFAFQEELDMKFNPILPFQTVKLNNYTIDTVSANHQPLIGDAMNYIVEHDGKKILLASDTGLYHKSSLDYLKNFKIDLVIVEATRGNSESNIVHLNFNEFKKFIELLKSGNTINDNTKIYATHFAHQHCPPHDELVSFFEKIDVLPAYDGLEIEL